MTEQPLQAVSNASDPFDAEGPGQPDVIPPEGVGLPEEPAQQDEEELDPAVASTEPDH